MAVKAKVWDDFGVRRVGMTYTIAGQPPQDVVLAENVAGKERKDVGHLVSLEKMEAQPDQLLSYYLWVEDMGPDGKIRRSMGDMFFAEVRPFEEIFRQGEQPSAEQQQQQVLAAARSLGASELGSVSRSLNAVIVNCRVALGVLSGRFHFVSMMSQ
jgi:hypothetical protein